MNKLVLRLTITNATPLLVGWYDPYIQDPIGIRVTEIKGIWRWWCRAFIAGAMFDQGMLCGRPDSHILCAPRREEAEAISCLVGKILGLGYAGEHGGEASRFRLFIEKVEGDTTATEFRDHLQRIRLLSLRRKVDLERKVEGLDVEPRRRFTLTVEKVRRGGYEDAEDLALRTLIVSLQLSGIGKGGRRGLGSLDIVYVGTELLPGVEIKNVKNFIEEVYNSSTEIVRKYKNKCRFETCSDNTSREPLPPIPAVSKRKFNNTNIFQIFRIDTKDNRDFSYVHNFFVRSERCKQLTNKSDCVDDLRRYHYAWFLGLPREQKGTGYIIKSKSISRRPSPVILAYHSDKNRIFGQGAFISVFLSSDWPKELTWSRGRHSKPIRIDIDFDEILNAYNTFTNEFNQYLSRKKLNSVLLWP